MAKFTFNNKENRSHKNQKFSYNWEAFECNKVNESIVFNNGMNVNSVIVKCNPKLSINSNCFETDTSQADSGKEKSRKNNTKRHKLFSKLSKKNEDKHHRIKSLHSTECETGSSCKHKEFFCNTLLNNYDNNIGHVRDMHNFTKNSTKSVKPDLWNDIVQPCFVNLKRIDFKLEQIFQFENCGSIFSHCSKNDAKPFQAVENQGVFGTINLNPEEKKEKKLVTGNSVLGNQSKKQGVEFQMNSVHNFKMCCNSTSSLQIHNKDKKHQILKTPKEVPINIGRYEMIRPCRVCLNRINVESFLPTECINSKRNVISHNDEPTKKKAKLADECKRLVLNKYKYCKSFICSNDYNLPPQLNMSVGKFNSLGSRQLSRVPLSKNNSNSLKSLQKYSSNNVEAGQVPFSVDQVNLKVHSILPLERSHSSYSDMNFLPHMETNSDIQFYNIIRPCSVRVLRLDIIDISKERINQHSNISVREKALPSIAGEIGVKTIAMFPNTSKFQLYNTQQEILSDPAVVDGYHENKGVYFDNCGWKIKLKPCYVRIERFSFEKYVSETTIREGKREIFEACDPLFNYKETTLKCLGQKDKSTSKILELKYDLKENKLETSEDTFAKKRLMEYDKLDVNAIDKSESIEFLPRNTVEFVNSKCVLNAKKTPGLPCSIVKKMQLKGYDLESGGIVETVRRKSLEKSNVDSVNSNIKTIKSDWCKRNVKISDSFSPRTTFKNSFSDKRNIEGQEENLTVISRKIKIRRHICVQCYALLQSAKALYDHICNGKSKKGYVCQFCEKLFKTKLSLRTHTFSHIVTK